MKYDNDFVSIKIRKKDYFTATKAYSVAVCLLAQQYSQPKAGRESDWKKQKRKENLEMAKDFNDSYSRFLEAGREWQIEKL